MVSKFNTSGVSQVLVEQVPHEDARDNVTNEEIQAVVRLLNNPSKQGQNKCHSPMCIGIKLKRFIRYQ